ncbi:MAG: hypothetical protein PHQ40_02320 [Anaerolineaceae bacterium]|nr:hypothetical protein [Anaerolineaceae bacterium]
MIQTNEFSDSHWGQCLSVKNDTVELTIPCEFGPRVIRYAFIGERNVFAEFHDQKSDGDKSKWNSYGGHRLWHAPEDIQRTYLPDNDPIQVETSSAGVILRQPVEAPTRLQKEIELRVDATGTHILVTHRIRNHNLFAIRLAVWAISVMATQGRAIVPFPPRGRHDENHLQAQTSLTLWSYTNLSDPRWQFGQKYLSLRQVPSLAEAQKIGIARSGGWIAYLNEGITFVKKCRYIENQTYPDHGSSFEFYTDHKCLEMESLSPLITIEPGGYTGLVEDWYLMKNIDVDASEADLDNAFAQVIP